MPLLIKYTVTRGSPCRAIIWPGMKTSAFIVNTSRGPLIDQPALIYFGYTFCPDVCPIDVARNAQAVEILEERGEMVKPVFISVDPKRDTPEVVDDFTANLHPRMLGLTGSPEQVKAASQAYRTYYNAQDSGDDEYYLVDHSTMTYLVFPEIGFADFFRRDASAEEMADRVQCFLDAR